MLIPAKRIMVQKKHLMQTANTITVRPIVGRKVVELSLYETYDFVDEDKSLLITLAKDDLEDLIESLQEMHTKLYKK